jgi:hypothetical protein
MSAPHVPYRWTEAVAAGVLTGLFSYVLLQARPCAVQPGIGDAHPSAAAVRTSEARGQVELDSPAIAYRL